VKEAERIMRQVPSRPGNELVRPLESLAIPVLKADIVWEILLGIGLVLAAVGSVTRPLGSAAVRPGFIPVIIGLACLALGAFLIYASKQPRAEAAAACRPLAAANLAAAGASLTLVVAFPDASHLYVVALTVVSTTCAIFAAAEWAVSQPNKG
jgi:hypothetical protein